MGSDRKNIVTVILMHRKCQLLKQRKWPKTKWPKTNKSKTTTLSKIEFSKHKFGKSE